MIDKPSMKSLDVPITIETDCRELGDETSLMSWVRDAVIATATAQGFSAGSIGVLITDDETIHEINREHLDHDYPTDVISFAYAQQSPHVEGELVASFDTAKREAASLQWATLNELLLYVVHGTLHICGLDDTTAPQRQQMRIAEQQVLCELGITHSDRFAPDAESTATISSSLETRSDLN